VTTDDRLLIIDGEGDTAAVREYEATRRDLVRRGVLIGGLTVAAASVPTLLEVGRAFAQADGDVPILAHAVGLEQSAVLLYAFANISGKLEPRMRRVARHFEQQEQDHTNSLITALEQLGGTPPAKPVHIEEIKGLPQAAAGGRKALLEFAVAFEEMMVAAYYRAARDLSDAKLIQTGASIMGSEGQHLVVLRQALKRNPVPTAFATGEAK